MDWKEKQELNSEFVDKVAEFGDSFEDLREAVLDLEKLNEDLYEVNVNHNVYLAYEQERLYEENNELISKLKRVLGLCNS